MPVNEFHLFPQLPSELRLKIWGLARPPARAIHACINTTESGLRGFHEYFLDDCSWSFHFAILAHSYKVPSLLHVCRESRDFILPTYKSGFDVTRSLMFERSPRAAERPPAPFSRDPEERKLEVALSRVLFPCHHEYMVSNRKRPMYWDPEDDIIFFRGMQGPLGEDTYLAETACIWSYHGFSSPKIKGVKNFAMEFDYFARWILGRARDPFEDAKMLYVILRRRSTDGEEDWNRHKTRFMCWYQQLKIDNPSRFIGERKPNFDLRIVQSIERVLDDGAFEAAVSEHDIGGWKDDPNIGSWAPDEDSWRE